MHSVGCHGILHFFPTRSSLFHVFHSHEQQLIIIIREPNVSATMQQPSSVVHSKLQYMQPLNTQTEKSSVLTNVVNSLCFWPIGSWYCMCVLQIGIYLTLYHPVMHI